MLRRKKRKKEIYNVVLSVLSDNAYHNLFADDLNELLRKHGLAGFKRGDVKKPGPLFSTNNYAFKTPSPSGKYLEFSTIISPIDISTVYFRFVSDFRK